MDRETAASFAMEASETAVSETVPSFEAETMRAVGKRETLETTFDDR